MHWFICVRCEQEVEQQKHIYSSDCDEDCNECGYTRKVNTAHKDIYQTSAAGHRSICTACNREAQMESHVPDRNTKEWEDQHCVHCEFEMRSSDKHVHIHADVKYDSESHWGTCPCGEILEPEVHSWDFQTNRCGICGLENNTVSTGSSGNFFIDLWNYILRRK